MPGCVAVAQRTLDPLAQVRILARQPRNVKSKIDGLNSLDNGLCHSDCSEESGQPVTAQEGNIGNLDGQN